jgi:hypothetical protein
MRKTAWVRWPMRIETRPSPQRHRSTEGTPRREKWQEKRELEGREGDPVKIKTDEIASVIKQEIEQYSAELEVSEVGRVVEVGDGIARIYGLSNAMAGELLEFQTSDGAVMGQVFNLELDTVGAVIYGDYLSVKEGDLVKSPPGACSKCPSARPCSGASSTLWAARWTTAPPIQTDTSSARSTSSPPASPSVSRSPSPCRRASRPSTP